jgi:hypothetical protein
MTRQQRAARLLDMASAILMAGVATDSTAEHYRAGFHNPVMFVAPVMSSIGLTASIAGASDPAARGSARRLIFATSILTGLLGLACHLTNVSKRPGGWSSTSVFYGAPLAAPLAITMAGVLGLAASHVVFGSLDRSRARVLGCLIAAGLAGTSVEAAALHFRGAFQNPLMYAPVVLPPVAATALAGASLSARRFGPARALLRATSLLGMGGTLLHAWGVHRRMGGWRNWTQNVLAGPPLPAPPAFTGLALAGLAVLDLLESDQPRG